MSLAQASRGKKSCVAFCIFTAAVSFTANAACLLIQSDTWALEFFCTTSLRFELSINVCQMLRQPLRTRLMIMYFFPLSGLFFITVFLSLVYLCTFCSDSILSSCSTGTYYVFYQQKALLNWSPVGVRTEGIQNNPRALFFSFFFTDCDKENWWLAAKLGYGRQWKGWRQLT